MAISRHLFRTMSHWQTIRMSLKQLSYIRFNFTQLLSADVTKILNVSEQPKTDNDCFGDLSAFTSMYFLTLTVNHQD